MPAAKAAAIGSKGLRVTARTVLSGPLQMDNCLQVKGLRKLVHQMYGADAEFRWGDRGQVSGQRSRIARNINQALGPQAAEMFGHGAVQSAARRIEIGRASCRERV